MLPQPAPIVVMSYGFPWPSGGRADSRTIPVEPLPGTVTFGKISGCQRCAGTMEPGSKEHLSEFVRNGIARKFERASCFKKVLDYLWINSERLQ